jgi:hypothetical protein
VKTFITGAVGACLLLSIGPGAQAQPADPPITANLEPRFKLEALRFRAIDESGYDWAGSDEVYVTIRVPAREVATRSQVFGNVDTGVTVDIPLDQSCILPIAGVSPPKTLFGDWGDRWSCSPHGAPGPFSFTVVLREKDPCPLPCFVPGIGAGGEGPIGPFDGLIGRHEVVYSTEELIALQVGQVIEESVTLGGPCGHGRDTCGGGGTGPWYVFTWRLTRLPDAEPVVGPISRLPDAEPVVGPTPF